MMIVCALRCGYLLRLSCLRVALRVMRPIALPPFASCCPFVLLLFHVVWCYFTLALFEILRCWVSLRCVTLLCSALCFWHCLALRSVDVRVFAWTHVDLR